MAWVQEMKQSCNCTGVQPSEDIPEGIMGRDAARQFQEGLKPGQLAPAEELDVDPRIGASDGGANRNSNDVHQFMASGAFYPWVVKVSEMIENSCLGWLRHVRLPPRPLIYPPTLAHF